MEVIYTVESAKIVQAAELMMCEPIVSKPIVAPVAGKVAARPMKMATSEMSVDSAKCRCDKDDSREYT